MEKIDLSETVSLDEESLGKLKLIAEYVRRDAFEMVQKANSGHIGASSSSAELLTALYFSGLFNFNPDDSEDLSRDRVLIRGHMGPARYPIFALLGYLDRDELWNYREVGSRLQGHEEMAVTPGVDITPSGSLGMLLSYGVGAALELKDEDRDNKVIVFLGDGEEQEGNVAEAARHATSVGIDNLICIYDNNKKQLTRAVEEIDTQSNIRQIWQGYGWDVLEIEDGNDMRQVVEVYQQLQHITKPTFVIAHTEKGRGLDGCIENFNGYHTISTCPPYVLQLGIDRQNNKLHQAEGDKLVPIYANDLAREGFTKKLSRRIGGVATDTYFVEYPAEASELTIKDGQNIYYQSLVNNLETMPNQAPFYPITPDYIMNDSAERLGFAGMKRFINTGIREQHAVALAHGISVTNPDARTMVYTGDAFALRCLDQINAAVQGGSNILMCGGDAGITNDRNGKTHQSVAQPGALVQIPDLKYYEPCDVRDYFNVLNKVYQENSGFSYVRMHWRQIPEIERNRADLENITAYEVFDGGNDPDLVVISSGFTVKNSIEAAKRLFTENRIKTKAINVVAIKGLSEVLPGLLETSAPVFTVYNGSAELLKDGVSKAVMSVDYKGERPKFIGGTGFNSGTSGRFMDLEKYVGLDVESIVRKLREFLSDADR